MIVDNGSGFDSYVVLNNLPQWRTVVNIIKKGTGIVSFEVFNGYVERKTRKSLKYVNFRCGRVHIINSLKKIGISYELKALLLKQDMDDDEIYEDAWEDKETEWLPHLKNDVLSTSFRNAKYSKRMEELTGLGLNNSLTLPL